MESDPDLDSELASARLDEAAAARRRRRSETELAAMESSLRTLLAGAAAAGRDVRVDTTDGRSHRGRVTGVGDDVVVLDRPDGGQVTLRTAAVAVVDIAGGRVVDERPGAVGTTTLHEVVAAFAGTRGVVTMVCAGGHVLEGEVSWCGEDVAAIRPTAATGEVVVYLASVNEVSSAGSAPSL